MDRHYCKKHTRKVITGQPVILIWVCKLLHQSPCFCTNSTSQHVKVSLSQTMHPKLLPVTWLQPCTLGINGQWLMGGCICACLHSFLPRQSEGLWEKYKKNVQSVFILRDKEICICRLNLCLDSTGKIVYRL